MKKLLGIFSLLAVVTLFLMVILSVWGENPISWLVFGRVGLTVFLALVGILLLWLCCYLFFRREKHSPEGRQAHPIK